MKVTSYVILLLYCFGSLFAGNIALLFDTNRKEVFTQPEFDVTFQLATLLQQKAAPVLASGSLWYNILQRKKRFAKEVQKPHSLAYALQQSYNMVSDFIQTHTVKETNIHFNQAFMYKQYPALAHVSSAMLKQAQFDFLCARIDLAGWQMFRLQDLILFVPQGVSYYTQWCKDFLMSEQQMMRYSLKRQSAVVPSQPIQHVLEQLGQQWVVYLSGHGSMEQKRSLIAGFTVEQFKDFLHLCEQLSIKGLVYNSCYAGGKHTILPYVKDNAIVKFSYPIIVNALTEAPMYMFGLASGYKLPPYNATHHLDLNDVKNKQLQFFFMQKFNQFFKRAHAHQFDKRLAWLVNQYEDCKQDSCVVKQVENIPLLRKAGSDMFIPLASSSTVQMVMKKDTDLVSIVDEQAVFLYSSCVTRMKFARQMPIMVPMLPAQHVYKIGFAHAQFIPLSHFIKAWLSLEDAQYPCMVLIDQMNVYDDVLQSYRAIAHVDHMMIMHNMSYSIPYITGKHGVIVHTKSGWYALSYNEHNELVQKHHMNDMQIKAYTAWYKKLAQKHACHGVSQLQSASAVDVSQKLFISYLNECRKSNICV